MLATDLETDSDRVSSLPDLNRLNHASVPQLSQDQVLVKLTRSLPAVGLDTANEVRICSLQSLH